MTGGQGLTVQVQGLQGQYQQYPLSLKGTLRQGDTYWYADEVQVNRLVIT